MKTLPSPFGRSRFGEISELLLVVLLVVSLAQIGLCLKAGLLLLQSPAAHATSILGAQLGTNAPAASKHPFAPVSKSAGFPSSAIRG